MAWSGFSREAAGESGLELRLGLPAYFTKPVAAAAGLDGEESSDAGEFARRPSPGGTDGGYKAKTAAAAAPVVGWPPVRSFRRNLAASKPSSSKDDGTGSKDDNGAVQADGDEREGRKGAFVKINMDGVPIGRKVELKEHGSYADLSATVDHLFRGLLAAQRDPAATAGDGKLLAISGGEYTLVYEDDEGDRMLVGDVPWKMFIATAKRLRVLKSSDLRVSSLTAGSRKRPAAPNC